MGLYRRKDSAVYWMSFTRDGRPYNKSTGTDNKEVAQKIYNILKGKIALGQWHPEAIKEKKREYTFRELAEKYLEWLTGRQKSEDRKRRFIKQLVEKFGDTELSMFAVENMEQWQSERIQKGNKPATANRLLATLKHMFTKAGEWEMVSDQTLKRVRKVKLLKESNSRLRYLSIEESQALIEKCDSHLQPIVITALNTGMRKGEILSLKWDNVDIKHGFILLTEDITKNGTRREMPISATLRAALQGITRRLDIPHVFYDPATGNPYQDVKRSFSTALKNAEVLRCTKCDYQKAKDMTQKSMEYCPQCKSEIAVLKGIKDFRFHDLRHTFASHLVMAGVDITTVKELLGHKDIKTTLRYAHLAPAHKVKAMVIYDQVFNGKSTEKEADYYDSTTLEKKAAAAVSGSH